MTRTYVVNTWRSQDGLLERTRSITNIIGAEIVGVMNEALLEAAIDAKIGELLPLIGERLESGREGYLLRINLQIDPVSGAARPTSQLISAIGPGAEPVDALARSMLTGAINTRAPNAALARRYLWCTRNAESLTISCAAEVLGTWLETEARTEARRRHLLGASYSSDAATNLERVERAKMWQKFTEHRANDLANTARRGRILALNRAFEAAQDRFNDAYTQFQIAQKELAAAAKESALLGRLSTVLGLLRAGLEARGVAPGGSDESSAAIRWQEHQIERLDRTRLLAADQLDGLLNDVQRLDAQLRTEWSQLGATMDDTEWLPPRIWLH